MSTCMAHLAKLFLTSALLGLNRGHKRTDGLLEQFRQTLEGHVVIWDIYTCRGFMATHQTNAEDKILHWLRKNAAWRWFNLVQFKMWVLAVYREREPPWESHWPSSVTPSRFADAWRSTFLWSPASCLRFFCTAPPVEPWRQQSITIVN